MAEALDRTAWPPDGPQDLSLVDPATVPLEKIDVSRPGL